MKKFLFLFLILTLIACASPQVAVTSTASPFPTDTPIPTPTLHPQFIELQNLIDDSGERFSLMPDGTIQETTPDGVKTVSGITVQKDGTILLQVGDEQVKLEKGDINFDDEKGVNVKGYILDEAISKWENLPVYRLDQLSTMTPEQIMASVPEMAGYEKVHQFAYVHYVNAEGMLGASYNLLTGEKVVIPENLQALEDLPKKIESGADYSELDVNDLPGLVAWMHYHYDEKVADLQNYPFVPKDSTHAQGELKHFGVSTFFERVEHMEKYAIFPGMVKIVDGDAPLFWGYPRLIKDSQDMPRVQLSSDAWDDKTRNDPAEVNGTYYRLTANPVYADKWQISQFSSDKDKACRGYDKYNGSLTEQYDGCMTYLQRYYSLVKRGVAQIVEGGAYPDSLESTPIFFSTDATN